LRKAGLVRPQDGQDPICWRLNPSPRKPLIADHPNDPDLILSRSRFLPWQKL